METGKKRIRVGLMTEKEQMLGPDECDDYERGELCLCLNYAKSITSLCVQALDNTWDDYSGVVHQSFLDTLQDASDCLRVVKLLIEPARDFLIEGSTTVKPEDDTQ
jgi:hypothetical protein